MFGRKKKDTSWHEGALIALVEYLYEKMHNGSPLYKVEGNSIIKLARSRDVPLETKITRLRYGSPEYTLMIDYLPKEKADETLKVLLSGGTI